MTTDVVDDGRPPEEPIKRLKGALEKKSMALGEREQVVLTSLLDLADAVLRHNHRLNHIRDEKGKGLPLRDWEEARRSAFITALVCYELERLAEPQRG